MITELLLTPRDYTAAIEMHADAWGLAQDSAHDLALDMWRDAMTTAEDTAQEA